jgi:hypothetical protein
MSAWHRRRSPNFLAPRRGHQEITIIITVITFDKAAPRFDDKWQTSAHLFSPTLSRDLSSFLPFLVSDVPDYPAPFGDISLGLLGDYGELIPARAGSHNQVRAIGIGLRSCVRWIDDLSHQRRQIIVLRRGNRQMLSV